MTEPNMELEEQLRKRFNIGYSEYGLVIEYLREVIEEAETRAYEKGKAECCVSKLGCLCNPVGNCNFDTCPCPEHYGTHDERLSSLIHDNK